MVAAEAAAAAAVQLHSVRGVAFAGHAYATVVRTRGSLVHATHPNSVAQGEQEMANIDNNQWDWDEEDNYTAQEQQNRRRHDSWDDVEDSGPSNSDPYASVTQVSSAPVSATRRSSTSSPVQENTDDLFAVRAVSMVLTFLALIRNRGCLQALEMNAAPRFNHTAAVPKPQPVKYNNTSRISTLAADVAVTANKV
jgi:hypothetical protein